MSEHVATIYWKRTSADFSYATYNREHTWRFDNGVEVAASATLAFKGSPACVDPEEAFVASLSSCHMLTFLAIASRKNLVVDAYHDDAAGYLEKSDAGKLWIARVTLRPSVTFQGPPPSADALDSLHDAAHHNCFLANSVKTEVTVEPR